MLRRISKNTVAAQVINQLTDLIRGGKLNPGDRLPPEREMAEQLGVSRPPIRESLRALEYAGVLETRYGDGVYVRSVSSLNGGQPELVDILNRYTLEEMVEMRKVVEAATAGFAAERATSEDLDRLADIHRGARVGLDDMEAFVESDFAFHSAIAEATGNSLFCKTVQAVRTLMGEFNRELLNNRDARETVWNQHGEILDALTRRMGKSAEAAMERHLANVVAMSVFGFKPRPLEEPRGRVEEKKRGRPAKKRNAIRK